MVHGAHQREPRWVFSLAATGRECQRGVVCTLHQQRSTVSQINVIILAHWIFIIPARAGIRAPEAAGVFRHPRGGVQVHPRMPPLLGGSQPLIRRFSVQGRRRFVINKWRRGWRGDRCRNVWPSFEGSVCAREELNASVNSLQPS